MALLHHQRHHQWAVAATDDNDNDNESDEAVSDDEGFNVSLQTSSFCLIV